MLPSITVGRCLWIVGWNLSNRCRTEDALAAVEQAVLERLPKGSRGENLTLTTDNGTQFTSSRFLDTQLGTEAKETAPGAVNAARPTPWTRGLSA